MAKTVASSDGQPVEQLNALIPSDLKRRMKIAAANTGRSMTDLLVDWISVGLSAVESPVAKPARGKGRAAG